MDGTLVKTEPLSKDSNVLQIAAPVRKRASLWRRFAKDRVALVSLGFIGVLALMAIFAPVVARHDPVAVSPLEMLQGPSRTHLLGTDQVGRDVWARVVYASRISLMVGVVSMSIATVIAVILGGLSGYYGGTVDMIIMRITEIMMTFPSLILIMTVVATIGPGIFNIMAILGLLGWPGMTRLLRGQILSVRERDYVTAARCVGMSDRRLIFRHVLPNAFAPVLVASTLGVAGAILTEAGLSFLGLGVLPPTPTWGNMLNSARSISILEQNWWLWVSPGVAILLTTLAINFVGDGLRDAVDPRLGGRGE